MIIKVNLHNVDKEMEQQITYGTYKQSTYLSNATKRLYIKKKRWLQPDSLDIIQKDLQALLWEYIDTENLDIMISILEFIEDGQSNVDNPFFPFKDYDLRPLQIGIYINQFINQIIEAFQADDYRKLSINTMAGVQGFIEIIKNAKFYKMPEEEVQQLAKLNDDINQKLEKHEREKIQIKIQFNHNQIYKKIKRNPKKEKKKSKKVKI